MRAGPGRGEGARRLVLSGSFGQRVLRGWRWLKSMSPEARRGLRIGVRRDPPRIRSSSSSEIFHPRACLRSVALRWSRTAPARSRIWRRGRLLPSRILSLSGALMARPPKFYSRHLVFFALVICILAWSFGSITCGVDGEGAALQASPGSSQTHGAERNLISRLRAVEEALGKSTVAIDGNTRAIKSIGSLSNALAFAGVAAGIATLLFTAIGMVNQALRSFIDLRDEKPESAKTFAVDVIDIYRYSAFVLVVVLAFLVRLWWGEMIVRMWRGEAVEWSWAAGTVALMLIGGASLCQVYWRDSQFVRRIWCRRCSQSLVSYPRRFFRLVSFSFPFIYRTTMCDHALRWKWKEKAVWR